MSFRYLAALALLAGSGCRDAAGHEEKPATLVLLHGEVVTVDAQRPRAQAIAVRDDRILAVGSDAEVEKLAGPATERIDLRGRLAIPAFIEGHGHFAGLGESMLILDLRKAGSMQGIHIISDGPWVPKRLGAERARRTSYPWRSLIDAGAVVTNGTDTPVEDIDPILSFYGAVSRKTKDGTVFVPEQRVSREEALRAYTLSNAFAAFEENEKGSLTAGKLADITVLSRNILTVPEDEIPSARVDLTILGGAVLMARAR